MLEYQKRQQLFDAVYPKLRSYLRAKYTRALRSHLDDIEIEAALGVWLATENANPRARGWRALLWQRGDGRARDYIRNSIDIIHIPPRRRQEFAHIRAELRP